MILIVISFEKCRLDSSMNVETPGITSANLLCSSVSRTLRVPSFPHFLMKFKDKNGMF